MTTKLIIACTIVGAIMAASLLSFGSGGGRHKSGSISGPTGSTNGNLAAWSGTGGTSLADSGTAATSLVTTSRNVTAGTGMSGGGALSGDITLALSTNDPQALTVSDTITAANGLTCATGNLTMTQGSVISWQLTSLTACTGQTQGLCPLTKDINYVTTVANANDSVTLPAIPSSGSQLTMIHNEGANTLQIFPASGAQICSGGATCGSTNASRTQITKTTMRCYSMTSTKWSCGRL